MMHSYLESHACIQKILLEEGGWVAAIDTCDFPGGEGGGGVWRLVLLHSKSK